MTGPEAVADAFDRRPEATLRLHVVDRSRVGPGGAAGVQQSVLEDMGASLVAAGPAAAAPAAAARSAEDAVPNTARASRDSAADREPVSLSGTTVLAADADEAKAAAPAGPPILSVEQAAVVVEGVRRRPGADSTARLLDVCQVRTALCASAGWMLGAIAHKVTMTDWCSFCRCFLPLLVRSF